MKKNQFTGREKLKLSNGFSRGAGRLLTIILALCVFNLPFVGVFAQENPADASAENAAEGAVSEDALVVPEIPAEDPLKVAEQALSLGDPGTGGQAASPSSALGILRVILTLAVVAAAIYGIVFLIKRLSRGTTARDPFLKVLASTPVGTNRNVHIISVGPQAWLVGSAENGVSLISEIQDKETLDAMLLEESRRSAEESDRRLPNFKALLQRLGMPAGDSPPDPENIRRRGERLKGL